MAAPDFYLWSFPEPMSASDVQELRARLSPEEVALLESFSSPKRQRDFLCGRALLRDVLLSRYNIRLPDQILRTAEGKLYHSSGLDFSLSHSGGFVSLGISNGGLVGLDIQMEGPRANLERLVTELGARSEIKFFSELDESKRLSFFYRLWTLKEAYGKAVGLGLGRHLQMLEFDFAKGKTLKVPDEDSGTFYFSQLDRLWIALCHLTEVSEPPKAFSVAWNSNAFSYDSRSINFEKIQIS